jgi:outer membrane protein assembly factor BamB
MGTFFAWAAAYFTVGVLSVTLLALSLVPAGAQTAPSPDIRDDQFAVAYLQNPAHTNAITLDQSFAPPLRVLWNDTAEGAMSYPLIARGKIFIWVSHFTDQSQKAGRVYSLDKTTGTVVWQADLPSTDGTAGLAYDNGRIFLMTSDGLLDAFDADSGAQAWSVQLASSFADTPPTAANGTVFVGANFGGGNGTLFAIDETSGNVIWSQSAGIGIGNSPSLSGEGVFVSNSQQIYDFNPVTGAPLWHSNTTQLINATPAYYRGFLYEFDVGIDNGSGNFVGSIFDTNTGNVPGVFTSGQSFAIGPAIQGGAGYFTQWDFSPSGIMTGSFVAFDLRSGNTLWSHDAGSSSSPVTSGLMSPIVVNDTVYALDFAGTLHAFDRVSGGEVWSANGGPFTQETTIAPTNGMAAGEGVLVVPVGRHLYALAP